MLVFSCLKNCLLVQLSDSRGFFDSNNVMQVSVNVNNIF